MSTLVSDGGEEEERARFKCRAWRTDWFVLRADHRESGSGVNQSLPDFCCRVLVLLLVEGDGLVVRDKQAGGIQGSPPWFSRPVESMDCRCRVERSAAASMKLLVPVRDWREKLWVSKVKRRG